MARTCSGSTISAACSWAKLVSVTAPSWRSLISARISSRPGASGIQRRLARRLIGLARFLGGLGAGAAARPLLGPVGVVALAPALVGVALDLLLELDEA